MTREQRGGFTLIEILLVLGIMALLAGIAFAATGTVREKARETRCSSNLRQIGVAFAAYRQDYDGRDVGWPADMGYPRSPFLLKAYGAGASSRPWGDDIFRCAHLEPWQERLVAAGAPVCTYGYVFWYSWQTRHPGYPAFPDAVAARGQDMPVFVDEKHDFSPLNRAHPVWRLLVLRLDGRVSVARAPLVPSWRY